MIRRVLGDVNGSPQKCDVRNPTASLQHIMLWTRFPFWYHLTFLVSLVPLAYMGGQIAVRGQTGRTLRGADVMQVAERPSPRRPA
jgi:hypothetical protein